jgi:hypothetical protein
MEISKHKVIVKLGMKSLLYWKDTWPLDGSLIFISKDCEYSVLWKGKGQDTLCKVSSCLGAAKAYILNGPPAFFYQRWGFLSHGGRLRTVLQDDLTLYLEDNGVAWEGESKKNWNLNW